MTTELIERSNAELQADSLTVQVQNLIISNNEQRITAEDMIQGAKKLKDEIFNYLDPPRAKAYDDYKYHKQRLDDAIKPVEDAQKAIKQKCIAYDTEQERIRQEEQRRLEAEARKRAEEEALTMAAQAEAEGDKETAEAIIEAPLDIPPVMVQKTSPAPSRLTAGRAVWSGEVVSLMILIKAVAEGKEPISLLMVNQTALNNSAKLIKVNGKTQNGWKVVEKKV